jgi:hypothetical protein
MGFPNRRSKGSNWHPVESSLGEFPSFPEEGNLLEGLALSPSHLFQQSSDIIVEA